MLALAIATSIDALMVGLTFAFLEASILVPVLIIGSVTFFLSFAGFMFGCGIGSIFGKRIEALGGIDTDWDKDIGGAFDVDGGHRLFQDPTRRK